ncbi:MAG: amidohydrolase family protein, partial [Sphingopyxis sp.]
MRLCIHNVRIFDGSGDASRHGAVMIEGERIIDMAYGENALADAPADQRIDGQGQTLMPGMVEGHAHLSWGSSVEKIYHQFVLPTDELRVATWRNARVLLDHGFTSAYSAGALGDQVEVDLAAELAAGTAIGPRFIPSTIERSPEGEDGVETGDVFNGRGADAMRAFIQHCKDTGVKSVKLVISGEDALKPGSSQDILYTDEEVA